MRGSELCGCNDQDSTTSVKDYSWLFRVCKKYMKAIVTKQNTILQLKQVSQLFQFISRFSGDSNDTHPTTLPCFIQAFFGPLENNQLWKNQAKNSRTWQISDKKQTIKKKLRMEEKLLKMPVKIKSF